eukprot:3940510-Rhodomonas_salina.2
MPEHCSSYENQADSKQSKGAAQSMQQGRALILAKVVMDCVLGEPTTSGPGSSSSSSELWTVSTSSAQRSSEPFANQATPANARSGRPHPTSRPCLMAQSIAAGQSVRVTGFGQTPKWDFGRLFVLSEYCFVRTWKS